MVDKTILAKKLAAVRDAVARIAEVLPATPDEFRADRTTREVVILNLFLALQDCIGIATHWLADAGWDVPQSYGEVFTVLGERGVLTREGDRRRSSATVGGVPPPAAETFQRRRFEKNGSENVACRPM